MKYMGKAGRIITLIILIAVLVSGCGASGK